LFANHLRESAAVKLRTIETCTTSILAAAEWIAHSFRFGGKLLLCGNGGSAADCQHLAAEFTSRLSADFVRPGLPAIALTTDASFLTAYANDFDFDGVFARQVQALGKPGDVLLGISTSGRSKNVVRAVEAAREMGLKTVLLTGARDDGERGGVSPLVRPVVRCAHTARAHRPPWPPLLRGGSSGSGRVPLLRMVDVAICVPSDNTQHIQEAHIAIEHVICFLVERARSGTGQRQQFDGLATGKVLGDIGSFVSVLWNFSGPGRVVIVEQRQLSGGRIHATG